MRPTQVLVGTESNEVIRVQLHPPRPPSWGTEPASETAAVLTQGHAGGLVDGGPPPRPSLSPQPSAAAADGASWKALRALCEHPRQPRFASAADDGTVKLWSLKPHRLHASRRLRAAARCAAFSADGAHLALGCADGGLVVLAAEDLSMLVERDYVPPHAAASASASAASAACAAAQAAAYSPDGRLLALGGACRRVLLYLVRAASGSAERAYSCVASCVGHSGGVTHVGWSCDSSCVRSNCDASELRF